jgi:hypothetical protein
MMIRDEGEDADGADAGEFIGSANLDSDSTEGRNGYQSPSRTSSGRFLNLIF